MNHLRVWVDRTFRFLCSLKLAVGVMLVLGAGMTVATVLESLYDTATGQFWVYRAGWFSFTLFLLGVNILSVALSRWPWKKRHLPFLLAHLGILMLLFGSWVTQKYGLDGSLRLEEGQASGTVEINEAKLWILEGADKRTYPVKWTPPHAKFSPIQISELGLEIDQFLSFADSDIAFLPTDPKDAEGAPALKVELAGGPMRIRQEFQLWGGGPGWNQLQAGPAVLKLLSPTESLTIQFPYWGEIFTLRADLAVKSFMHEMGKDEPFVVSPEGYDQMIEGLIKDLEKRGVELKRRHTLTDVVFKEKNKIHLTFAVDALDIEVIAQRVIFALPQVALAKLKFFKHLPILKYIKMEPLVRIYAVFPTGSDGKTWFHDIGRFVTATPIRYFIPVGPTTVMISYTDGDDTLPWSNLEHGTRPIEEETIGVLVTHECQKLFPEKNIPFPTFLKVHPWDAGASYWVPGNYDPAAVQKKSLQPFPNMYICGESFCLRQAWMEGALENTEELLRIL